MPRFRTVVLTLVLLGLGTGVWAAIYAYDKGFTKKWRRIVTEELERRGITATIEKLTLHPVEGFVARGVTVYDDDERTRVLAEVNQLALDIDLARLLRKEDFLRRIDVRSADFFLPLDPEDPRGRRLEIRNVDARVSMLGDTIEISEVSALFYGIRLSLNGSLLKPIDASESGITREEREKRNRDRLEALTNRRGTIWRFVDTLGEFSFDPLRPPELSVRLSGDLEDLETAEIEATFEAGPTGFRDYLARRVAFEAFYANGAINLRSFEIEDGKGRLDVYASFQSAEPARIPFTADSSIDLPALIAAFLPRKELNELVFYAPPEIHLEGEFLVDEFRAGRRVPVRAIGSIGTGMVTSRGVIAESVEADFSVEPDRFYLRNTTIRHTTGTLRLDAISEPESGLRWRARMNADPALLTPFAVTDGMRRLLQRITWTDESSVIAEAEGWGPSLSPGTWTADGTIEARRFAFNGVPMDRLESEFSKDGLVLTFADVEIERPEGTTTAQRVDYDLESRTVKIEGAHSTADPVAVTAIVSPRVAEFLRRYRFSTPPETRVAGTIDVVNKVATDFHAEFVAPGGGRTPLAGAEREFAQCQGRVHVLGRDVGVNITGTLAAGTRIWDTTFADGCRMTATGWHLRSREAPIDIDLEFEPEGRVIQTLFGKPLPLQGTSATIEIDGRDVAVKAQATVFGGPVSLAGKWSGVGTPEGAYRATVAASKVGYRQLAQLYSDTSDTEGVISGNFAFSGRIGAPDSLAGAGNVAIADSNLYAVPIFGPLSALISLALPLPGGNRLGYSVAREATASFTVENGVITTEDFEALTPAFRLRSWGTIDYAADQLALRARMNIRGAPGIVFLPVSKLFEYQGEGTIADPIWTSVTLDGLTGGALSEAAQRNRERSENQQGAASAPDEAAPSAPPAASPPARPTRGRGTGLPNR